MVVYTKLMIAGVEFSDAKDINLSKSMNTNNSISTLTINFDNYYGKHTTDISVGNEVLLYADSSNPPTTKIFAGNIIDKTYDGSGSVLEYLQVSCKDFASQLQNANVEIEVYSNQTISFMITDLMQKYAPSGFTTTGVTTISTVIPRLVFKQKSIFDCLMQLIELAGDFFFYVDEDKILYVLANSSVSSGVTINNTNCLSSNFRENIDNVKNKIYVYGDRQLVTQGIQTFTSNGIGSSYTLNDSPTSTKLTYAGSVWTGGVLNMNITPASGVQYLVNYQDKKIVLVSGTYNGNNILPNGSNFTVEYQISRPIVKVVQDQNSIDAYGLRMESINDKAIKDPDMAKSIATSKLELKRNPLLEGNCNLQGVVSLTPGNTVTVNLPNKNQVNETYDIIEANYMFNKANNRADKVLSVRLNERIPTITDVLKDMLLNIKRLDSADIDTTAIIPRIFSFTGSEGIGSTTLSVSSRNINDSFVVGHPINGVMGNVGNKAMYFKFDTSGTWIDDVVGGVSGTLLNNAFISGTSHFSFGSSLCLNGSTDYMRIYPSTGSLYNGFNWFPGSALLGASGAGSVWGWSINTWINCAGSSLGPSGANWQTIVGNRMGDDISFYISGTNLSEMTLALRVDDCNLTTGGSVNCINTWANVGVSWKLNSRTSDLGSPYYPVTDFYYNGSLIRSGSVLYQSNAPFSTIGSILVGNDTRQNTKFNGLISDLRIYPRFIESVEHNAIYTNSVSGLQPILGDRRGSSVIIYSGA
jgi:hypothetical protein